MKKLILIFVVMFSTLAVRADIHDNAGTSASAFLKLGTGAPEAQALGNAFTALSHGTQALFWNPAGAATATTREFQVSHMQWFEGVGDSAILIRPPTSKAGLICLTPSFVSFIYFAVAPKSKKPKKFLAKLTVPTKSCKTCPVISQVPPQPLRQSKSLKRK